MRKTEELRKNLRKIQLEWCTPKAPVVIIDSSWLPKYSGLKQLLYLRACAVFSSV